MKFKSYNSAARLSDYTVGDVYAFYVRNTDAARLITADSETIGKYAPAFAKAISDNQDRDQVSGRWQSFVRALGVVVNKREATEKENVNYIVVMLQTADGKYVLNKYAVETHDIFMNSKELVQPSAFLDL